MLKLEDLPPGSAWAHGPGTQPWNCGLRVVLGPAALEEDGERRRPVLFVQGGEFWTAALDVEMAPEFYDDATLVDLGSALGPPEAGS